MSVFKCEGLFGDVLTSGIRGEGRRDWKVDLRYGVKKNNMITLESIELSFFDIYFFKFYLTFILS